MSTQVPPPDPQHDITDIARQLDLPSTALRTYGRDKAKIDVTALGPLQRRGKLVLVSGITPTAAGEGKTTTAIGLADGLRLIGQRAVVILREPSLGPIFGQKGGGTGFGRSRIIPTADINLHFNGDFHAITAAHNLLSAMVDNHLHHNLEPQLDPDRITWKRALDVNDRALRSVEVGRGKGNGPVHASGFDITAASEIMAILALSENADDLRARLSRIVIGHDKEGKEITAAQIRAIGAMMALLRDAMQPNLAATLEGTPAIVHCGPFANIAHGTASIAAMKVGLHTADIGVVEAGFGFDLGGEKFFDLVMRGGPMSPAAVVIIVSLRALRLHGGVAADQVATPNQAAVVAGLPNMIRHIENASLFKRPVIIALNAFPHDSVAEVTEVRAAAERAGASFAVIDATMRGAEGGVALAQVVTAALAGPDPGPAPTLYAPDAPLREKIERVATSIYRATSVVLSDEATAQLADLEARGYGKLPVCMAKTPASFSDDPSRINTPEGHTLTVRRFELAAGAGFVIALCGTIMRMPGLPREPRALAIDLVGNTIVGVE
ncbi:MAG: formate--tetrahydrofolate ligase [Myxococcales bacterium]|nr:formate--tetrahydrofolate ligase [Myxococcales bacterium]